MVTLILRMLKDKWISLTVYTGAGIAFLWMYVAMFPSILEQSEQFQELLATYPEGFLKAFGLEELDFSTIEKFVGLEHFSIVWPLMLIFMMAGFASNSIAKEIENGTAEILLSRPVSRLKLFFSRYITGLVVLLIFSALSIFAVIPLCEFYSVTYHISHFFSMTILGFLFGWAIFSLAMLFSVLFSEKSKVAMFTGGTLIFMYVLNLISSLKESFGFLKWGSLFYYFDYNEALSNSTIAIESIAVFIGVAVITTIIAGWWFNKRDIAV